MIVRRFNQWAKTATPIERAKGAGALAQAFLYADMDEGDREEAEIVLTALADDASPLVRRALADNLASAAGAPRAIIIALANDQSEVAAPVLGHSPLLTDADLIDCAAIGDAFAQSSIALRPIVSPAVAAALAEVGGREALISLAVNEGAIIPEFSIRRMIERWGSDAELRESLLARGDLSPAARSDLVAATAKALAGLVAGRGWMSAARMERVVRQSCDKAHVIIAADAEDGGDWAGARALAAHLRASGQLTSSLMLRAVLSNNVCLFEAALVELSGLPERKALALARQRGGAGLAGLFRAAGLPMGLLPAFQAATGAREAAARTEDGSPRLSSLVIRRVLRACEALPSGESEALLALLRRFEAEAAREDARRTAAAIGAPELRMLPAPEPAIFRPKRAIDIDLTLIEAELAA